MDTATATTLYARKTAGFDERVESARRRLARAAEHHAGRIVQASSLGAEDQVLTDLIAKDRLPIAVATLDTGMLHCETLVLIDDIRERYDIRVERYRPVHESVIAFVGRHGKDAMRQSVELRTACCAMRKVEPLGRMLAGRTAWITGLRREQPSRVLDALVEASGLSRVESCCGRGVHVSSAGKSAGGRTVRSARLAAKNSFGVCFCVPLITARWYQRGQADSRATSKCSTFGGTARNGPMKPRHSAKSGPWRKSTVWFSSVCHQIISR